MGFQLMQSLQPTISDISPSRVNSLDVFLLQDYVFGKRTLNHVGRRNRRHTLSGRADMHDNQPRGS